MAGAPPPGVRAHRFRSAIAGAGPEEAATLIAVSMPPAAVMRFDTAVEIITSQLRIELMFPADDAAEAYFQARRPT